MNKNKPLTLHHAQKRIANCINRFRVVICGRRFGKTTLSAYELVAKAFFTEDGSVAYVAPTNEDIRDIVWTELKKIAEPVATKINDVRMQIEIKNNFGGKSIIKTASWESIINKGRLRGQKFHYTVLDEVSSYKNFWVGWEEVIRPTLLDYKGEALFIGTPKGFNHFYDIYNLEREDDDYKSFHYTSYDNPHLPREEINKMKQQMTEDRFAQEILGEFKKMEGLIYKEFDRERHTFDDKFILPNFSDILVGVDWGWTNPCAVLKIGKDHDNNYYVLDEWYKRQKTTAEIIEQVKAMKPNIVYPDPAEPDRIKEMEDAGLNVREVSKDVVNGINAVRELFKQNRIKIHNKCVNLINELETYHYKEHKNIDVNAPEEPEKHNDHACDGLRYCLYMDEPTPQNINQDFNLYAENFH